VLGISQNHSVPMNSGWEQEGSDWDTNDGVGDADEDDLMCLTICLSKAGKKWLRKPWRKTLIVKLFDKCLGFMLLREGPKSRGALKGEFSLIDIDFDDFIVKFACIEDYEYVLTQGPWLIGDTYLTIKKWVLNFVSDEVLFRILIAWIRTPRICVEYFEKGLR